MAGSTTNKTVSVKIYHGYGHTNDLVVYGHVFKYKLRTRHNYTNNVVRNVFQLLRFFFVQPLPNANVQLQWRNQVLHAKGEDDGFFKFEWSSHDVAAGWHPVTVQYTDAQNRAIATGEGKVFVPHITQYGFISDIDDTVLISHSATIAKRLRLLFTKNPHTRKAFADVVRFYELLSKAYTTADVPNPFFYVSSSEWNLYDDLNEFFTFNGLPKGIFLLSQLKRWYELFKTGKTKHEGKLLRIMRIIHTFPNQKFILLGDNSQSDPAIYQSIVNKYPERIFAVFIRNIREKNKALTSEVLSVIEHKGVHTFLYKDSSDAIEFSRKIGLIE